MSAPHAPYDPWPVVEARPDVTVAWTPVARYMGGGFTIRRDGHTIIALDPDLPVVHRRAALTHELVHDERGGVHDPADGPDAWGAVVAREERAVDREVVRRLAPRPAVLAAVRRLLGDHGWVTARALADELELPEHLAALALDELGGRPG